MPSRTITAAALVAALLLGAGAADAQFRRGFLADTIEVTLYPQEPPAVLLPAGTVQVVTKNASPASARIVERVRETLERQIADNDRRLQTVERDGDVVVTATLIEWSESRRNSTKYVSEKRQVGTRQVKDKDGKTKTEPVYEYGRNKPSVVINGRVALRIDARRRGSATALGEQSARHEIEEEHLVESGPPTRDQTEDTLIDKIATKGAGLVTPGRRSVKVLLARSDEVERLNPLAERRAWQEWLEALEKLPPHRDRKRDAYRLHNIAVAHEAIAYEASSVEDWRTRLGLASRLMADASLGNPGEKYIGDASNRIADSVEAYQALAALYAAAGQTPASSGQTAPATASGSRAQASTGEPMSNRDIIELKQAGLDDANLVAAIRDARAVRFDLGADGLKALLAAGISNNVIAAMRTKATP